LKIILAPDSFKGSLSAVEAAEAMAVGVRMADPRIQTILLPVADGGEGTMESMVKATDGSIVTHSVEDPLGRPVTAGYGVLDNQPVCVIEIAEASGLTLLSKEELDPLNASSFGTGELIRHALDAGFREFIIGLGGSATNDGGAGILQALGAKLLDKNGTPLLHGGQPLSELDVIDLSGFDPRIQESRFTIACDVDNPFIGPTGASAIFGPQKGATPEMVKELDHCLSVFADKIEAINGLSLHQVTGAGAAGGAAGIFLAFFPSKLHTGIDVGLEAVDFDKNIQTVDLILTGEGRSDHQTLSGKAPVGIAKAARRAGIPVVLLSGGIVESSLEELAPYFEKMYALADGSIPVEQVIRNAYDLLVEKTKFAIQTIQTAG